MAWLVPAIRVFGRGKNVDAPPKGRAWRWW